MIVLRRLACLVLGLALLAPAGPARAAAGLEPLPLGVDPGAAIEGLDWPNRRFAPCSAYDAEAGRWIVFGGLVLDAWSRV